MPLNKAERKMKREMEQTYGKARGESIFYALEAQGKTPSDRSQKGSPDKKKFNKGGMVKANCGASTKPNRMKRN
jgi:hypothetical protein